ncbi:MAG: Rnf-Nqr domain containing protein [Alphaproteobacteria bacterium]
MNKNNFANKIKENYLNIYLLAVVPVLGSSLTLLSALAMAIILGVVLFFSNLIIFSLKNKIDEKFEMPVFVVVSAFVVTLVSMLLQLLNLNLYDSLKTYLPMIVFSCIIFKSFEETMDSNLKQTVDSVLYQLVVLIALMAFIGTFREFFGLGEILGYKIIDYGIPKILVLQTPAGAFFLLSFVAFASNWVRGEK